MTELHESETLKVVRYDNGRGQTPSLVRTAVASGWLYQHINTAGRSDAVTFVPDDDAPHVRKLREERKRSRRDDALRRFRSCWTCDECGEINEGGAIECHNCRAPQ
jgi:hypothetical protein